MFPKCAAALQRCSLPTCTAIDIHMIVLPLGWNSLQKIFTMPTKYFSYSPASV